MKWRRSEGEYLSDCGTYVIKKIPTHDANGNIMNRYPWQLYKMVCCYGLLGEAKASAGVSQAKSSNSQ